MNKQTETRLTNTEEQQEKSPPAPLFKPLLSNSSFLGGEIKHIFKSSTPQLWKFSKLVIVVTHY